METPPQPSTSYQLHKVIPAENIMIQQSTPPTAAQLLLQHLPSTSGTSGLGQARRGGPSTDQMDQYRIKYMALRKKCNGIQLGNEKLLNRLYHVRKAVRKLARERRFLMSKLDEFGDDYRSAQLPIPIEDESMLSLLSSGSALPSTYSPPKESPKSATKRSASPVDSEKSSKSTKSSSSKTLLSVKTPTSSPAGTKRRRSSAQSKVDKEKDPNAPKKPANAFLMFCQQERLPVLEEYSRENPNAAEMSHQDLTKELAKKWNDLTGDEKKTYYTMYDQDKRRYEREMRQYRMSESKSIKTIPSTATTPTISTAPTSLNAPSAPPPVISQPATIALTSTTVSQPKQPAVQVISRPIVTAPSVVQSLPPPLPASTIVKQEPMNNNNSMLQPNVGAKPKVPQTQSSAGTPRTLPVSTITLSKPSSSVMGHQLVTLTTSPATSSIIPGTTNYIKLSLGPALPLSSNTSVLVPPKTTAAGATAVTVAKTIPVTLTTKRGELVSGVGRIGRPISNIVTKVGNKPTGNKPVGNKPVGNKPTGNKPIGNKPISGQTAFMTKTTEQSKVTKKSAQATIASRLSGQASMAAKGSGQITTTNRSGGLVTMSVKNGGKGSITKPVTKSSTQIVKSTMTSLGTKPVGQSTLVTKSSGQGVFTTKSSGQGGFTTKSSGQGVFTTKSSGQGGFTTKSSGQGVFTTKSSGQGVFATKSSGQGVFTTKSSGQGVLTTKTSGQGVFTTKSSEQKVFTTKRSDLSAIVTKSSSQGTVGTKIIGQPVVVSKIGGQGIFTLSQKPSSQGSTATTKGGTTSTVSKLSGQAIMTTKTGGQLGNTGARVSGQGFAASSQGVSAAAVLSRLAAPAGGRVSSEGTAPYALASSRLTTTTMQHGGTTTHVSVVKETKKLLTAGQKPGSAQASSLLKKPEPEPMSKSDDPYHFDD